MKPNRMRSMAPRNAMSYRITELVLSCNPIGVQGARLLARALNENITRCALGLGCEGAGRKLLRRAKLQLWHMGRALAAAYYLLQKTTAALKTCP